MSGKVDGNAQIPFRATAYSIIAIYFSEFKEKWSTLAVTIELVRALWLHISRSFQITKERTFKINVL